jgi:phosphohistidine swiveling domain-containing protein
MRMKKEIPTTLRDLQAELHVHAQDGDNTIGMRLWIFAAQLGALAQHHTHDPNFNPGVRPHGTKASRLESAGHAVVQFLTVIDLLDIDIQDAVNVAIPNLRDKDFKKREAQNTDEDMIIGQTAFPGKVRGKAFVDPEMSKIQVAINMIKNSSPLPFKLILVTSHPEADARLAKFDAIVTDQGGSHCHAATIAREKRIPCIVGTGDATKRIKHGDIIEVNASGDQGQVWGV